MNTEKDCHLYDTKGQRCLGGYCPFGLRKDDGSCLKKYLTKEEDDVILEKDEVEED